MALAFTSQLIGQGLLVFALRHFSPLVVGLALLTQPAMAVAAGWLVFSERLGPADFAGMALVAAGLVLARSTER
ncbi:DMT family transporter [Novosphingobium sp.]|uniref:EamA family transporter n=1 Tax=Novosphingobium sp. TaxID=1874826 RepID=UPI0025E0586D|nr:DMT family transporter [Novosphingobium sp.]